ncbi:MAG: hypothetical protein M9962_10425 [Oligoflexia bacterium]|nr:hypothetical protein [Oligoflexia bacterium]
MKKWILGFVTAGLLVGSMPTLAEDVFRIEIGTKKRTHWNQKEAMERIYRLELAVEQLQRKVFDLESRQHQPLPEKKWTTCYINTPFDGTFTATEPTETAAKALALSKCNEKSSSTFCKERDIKCGN